MSDVRSAWSDEELDALSMRVSNAARWGPDDELGTLNYISQTKTRDALGLATSGTVLSLAWPITPHATPRQPGEVDHRMFPSPMSADDYLGLPMHQQGLTHLDCVSHVAAPDGMVYNGRRLRDVVTPTGLTHGSVFAQRGGIVTRGVLLDVPAGLGLNWLEPGQEIRADDLDAAARHGQVEVSTGDVAVVRGGTAAREEALGRNVFAPGLGPDAIEWLHDHEVAVYTGDMPDRVTPLAARILGLVDDEDDAPDASGEGGDVRGHEGSGSDGPAGSDGSDGSPTRYPLPLHQIGIAAMGLVLLDFCSVEQLARTCRELGRYEFLFVAAPLPVQGGTGSPVNPLAIF
ncbi:MAG: cyclase family protein [Nocardioidaceae bacterium]|nr:cyclase family protein [Nocardioidaceae bacterium]